MEAAMDRLYPGSQRGGGVRYIPLAALRASHVRQLPRIVAEEQCRLLQAELERCQQNGSAVWEVVAKLKEDVAKMNAAAPASSGDSPTAAARAGAGEHDGYACEREMAGMVEDAVSGGRDEEQWLMQPGRARHREYVTAYSAGWRQFLALVDVAATGHVETRGVGAMFNTVRACASALPVVAPLAKGLLGAYKTLWADRRLKLRLRRLQELDFSTGAGREGILRAVRLAATRAARTHSSRIARLPVAHPEGWRRNLQDVKEAWDGSVSTPARCLGTSHVMLSFAVLEDTATIPPESEQQLATLLERDLAAWIKEGVPDAGSSDEEEEAFLEGLGLDDGDGEEDADEDEERDEEEEFLRTLVADAPPPPRPQPAAPAAAKASVKKKTHEEPPPAAPAAEPKPPAAAAAPQPSRKSFQAQPDAPSAAVDKSAAGAERERAATVKHPAGRGGGSPVGASAGRSGLSSTCRKSEVRPLLSAPSPCATLGSPHTPEGAGERQESYILSSLASGEFDYDAPKPPQRTVRASPSSATRSPRSPEVRFADAARSMASSGSAGGSPGGSTAEKKDKSVSGTVVRKLREVFTSSRKSASDAAGAAAPDPAEEQPQQRPRARSLAAESTQRRLDTAKRKSLGVSETGFV